MCRSASAEVSCDTPDEGERFDDFDIRQEWWTGDALPEAKVVRRELAGVPRVEVVGLVAGEGRGTILGHDYPGQGRSRRSATEIISAHSCRRWNEMRRGRLDIAARGAS